MSTDQDTAQQDARREDRLWRRWVFAAIGSFVLASLLLGTVVLPLRANPQLDPWSAICTALGISSTSAPRGSFKRGAVASDVIWNATTRLAISKGDPVRGYAIVKDNCSACHGDKGISTDPQQFPNLAGQAEAAIFKQLKDFKSGSRASDIMGPVAQALTDQQIEDVSAYFSAQTPFAETGTSVSPGAFELVHLGNPSIALPPCVACHNSVGGGPEGAPTLTGQSAWYLEDQLKKFASGERHNDKFARMRVIAKDLTAEQMHELAQYYGGTSPP